MQCAYRSKFCDAPRATKLDGTLHKLCDFHRRKANANQQRLHKRKKRILEQQASGLPQPGHASKHARLSRSDTVLSSRGSSDVTTFQSCFDLLEVKILEVLLFGADATTTKPIAIKDEDGFRPVSPTTPSMVSAPVFDGAWSVTL
ncbi:hypothetical protein PsorP6_012449 [Peronosclerospora sorghi]|uniref:Uncharacterized protein n=1 Tax=Peronosclerospora sorghi TaxID=230839 RepID=A0ACC0WHK4_9STRA|nr:hypothetical protein PsorP6_012449 [Peronosclerospora sorghi]